MHIKVHYVTSFVLVFIFADVTLVARGQLPPNLQDGTSRSNSGIPNNAGPINGAGPPENLNSESIPMNGNLASSRRQMFNTHLTEPVCREGWLKAKINNVPVCVFFNKNPLTWEEARDSCRNEFGFLIKLEASVSIGPLSLQQYLVNNHTQSIWTGLHMENKHLMWDELTPHLVRHHNNRIWDWDIEDDDDEETCGELEISDLWQFTSGNFRKKRSSEDTPDTDHTFFPSNSKEHERTTGIEQWNNRMKMRNKKVTLAAHTTRFTSAEQNFLKSLSNFDMNLEDQNQESSTRAHVESRKDGDDDDSDGPTTPSPQNNHVRAQFNLNDNREMIDDLPKVKPLNGGGVSNRQIQNSYPTSSMIRPQIISSDLVLKTDKEKTESNSDSDDENKKEREKVDKIDKESTKPEIIKQENIQPKVIQPENFQPEVTRPLNLPMPPFIGEPKEDKKEKNDDSSEVKSNVDNFQKIFGDKGVSNNNAKPDDETLTLSDLFKASTDQEIPSKIKKDDNADKNEDDNNKGVQGKLLFPDITKMKETKNQDEIQEDKSNDDTGVIKLSDIFDSKSAPEVKTDDIPTIESDDSNQAGKIEVESDSKSEPEVKTGDIPTIESDDSNQAGKIEVESDSKSQPEVKTDDIPTIESDDSNQAGKIEMIAKSQSQVFGGLFEELASISSNEPENNDDDDDNTNQTESIADVINETIEDIVNTDDNNDAAKTDDNNDEIIPNTDNVQNIRTTEVDDGELSDLVPDEVAESEVPGVSFIGQANSVPPPPPAVFTDTDDDSEDQLETLSERVEEIIDAISDNETDDGSSRDDDSSITEDIGNDADVFDVDSDDSGPPSVPDLIESILDDTNDNSVIDTGDDQREDNELPKEAASDGAEQRISDAADLDDLEELPDVIDFGGIGIEPTVLRQDIPPADRVQHIPQRPSNDFSNMIARRKAKMKLSKCQKKLPSVCFSYPVSLEKKASSCGDGWLGNIFVDKCYKVIFPAVPFANAVERCVQEGGRLSFVESELESRLLLMLIAKSQNDHYRPGTIAPIIWLNGDPIWSNEMKLCHMLSPKGASMQNCNSPLEAVCEKAATKSDNKVIDPSVGNQYPLEKKMSVDSQDNLLDCDLKSPYPELPTLWFKDGMLVDIKLQRRSESVLPSTGSVGRLHSPLPSPVACPTIKLKDKKTGLVAMFSRSATHTNVQSVELCDGERAGSASCNGDYFTGAYWDNINVHKDCNNITSRVSKIDDSSESKEDDDDDDNNGEYGKVMSKMTSEERLKELAESKVKEEDVETVIEETAVITEETEELTAVDVDYIAEIMEKTENIKKVTKQISKNILKTVDKVMKMDEKEIRKANKKTSAANRIIKRFEKVAETSEVEDDGKLKIVEENVAMEIWRLDMQQNPIIGMAAMKYKEERLRKTFIDKDIITIYNESQLYDDVEAAIELPSDLVQDAMAEKGKQTRLVMVVYRDGRLFKASELSPEDDAIHNEELGKLNSFVISASIGGKKIQGLKNKVKTVFTPLQKTQDSAPICAFWDFDLNDHRGGWSSEGCVYDGTVNGHEICLCDHLTNFAVLMDFHGQGTPIGRDHVESLSIISLIGLSLSILGLSLTIISYIFFKKLRHGRAQQTLFNLALAMLCSWVVFLVGIKQTHSQYGCLIVAALLHYFILSSFMWMLMEAFLQYLTFVKVLGTYVTRYTLKTVIIAWGLPIIPVICVLSIDYDLYNGGSDYCWMKVEAFYWAFALPVGLICLCNLTVFIVTIVSICRRPSGLRSNQSKQKLVIANLQAAITSFILLGLTWILGYLSLLPHARIVFQYAFTILNSLQGFFIFILFVARKKRVRDQWMIICCCKTPAQEKATRSLSASASLPSSCSSRSNYSGRTERSDSTQTTTSFVNQEYQSIYSIPIGKRRSRESLYYRKSN
ncbi:hypothetical protein KUTeg_020727 [Tegillarca granosa]|uniref:Uncharacterized protein n=1 Tax=Tegillarca granosa TaxID=220873 RepID=A0ABQ9EE90_TEGGR|nr:hypothetical protein KUTeg_020727 [Tegillarca granosa]